MMYLKHKLLLNRQEIFSSHILRLYEFAFLGGFVVGKGTNELLPEHLRCVCMCVVCVEYVYTCVSSICI